MTPKDEFWGGNGVPTNGTTSGVYDKDGNLVENFTVPDVDVPVKKPDVSPTTSNIYFGGTKPSGSDLYEFTVPEEAWKTAYVNITSPKDMEISNTEDGTYDVTVTVSPKYEGEYGEKSTTVSSTVNVFKPAFTVTAKDIWADYNVDVQLDNSDYGVTSGEPVWKHRDGENVVLAENVTMVGNAPAVEDRTYSFTQVGTSDGSLSGTTYTTGEKDADFNVSGMSCVVGKTDSEAGISYTVEDLTVTKAIDTDSHDFTIHINHFALTLEKKINGVDLYNQSFIFTVTNKTKGESFQVSLTAGESKTIVGMVCGMTYQVDEEESWSWRYSDFQNSYTKSNEISNTKPAQDTVEAALEETIFNTLKSGFDKWLSDCSEIKSNVFNKKTKSE